jgi:hypothetical protein
MLSKKIIVLRLATEVTFLWAVNLIVPKSLF